MVLSDASPNNLFLYWTTSCFAWKLGSVIYFIYYLEMYPECFIASWDALVFLLDAENVERRVQLNAEKKNRVYTNYKLQEKTASHDMQICVSWKQFLSADWLFTVNFAVNFQSKAEQPLCFLITFLSRSCLFSYVSIPTCCVALSELFSGETIGNNGDLQTLLDHVSRSWVFCMLSKRISRISLSIVSEMTENPTAK